MRAYGLRFLRIQKHTYARKTRNVYISSLDDVFWRIPAIATSGGAVLKLWNAFRTNDGRGISAETVFIKNNSGATFCLPFSTVVFGVKFETKSTQVSADKSTPHTCAFVAGEFSIPKKRCGVPSECMHKDTPNVPIITTAMSIAETSLFIKPNSSVKKLDITPTAMFPNICHRQCQRHQTGSVRAFNAFTRTRFSFDIAN